MGRFNPDIGGTSAAACTASPRGTYSPTSGAIAPTECAPGANRPNPHVSCFPRQLISAVSVPGYHQRSEGQTACEACSTGTHQPERGEPTCIPCPMGRYSVVGSPQCSICAEHHYRPSADSLASYCTLCDAMLGVSCGLNSTTATINLTAGYWRHSTATIEIYRCKSDGSWSPCSGGGDAGSDGNGYCADGYRGPRCELCDARTEYSRYFDKLDARCHDCGDVSALAVAAFCVLLLVFLAAVGGKRAYTAAVRCSARARTSRISRAVKRLTKPIRTSRKLWKMAGMRFKMKA